VADFRAGDFCAALFHHFRLDIESAHVFTLFLDDYGIVFGMPMESSRAGAASELSRDKNRILQFPGKYIAAREKDQSGKIQFP
jgi:hypothetical protein